MKYKDFFLSDNSYSQQMNDLVIPYTKQYEKDGCFTSFDDTRIYYRCYIKEKSEASVVILHGYTENSEKYREVIYYFLKCNFNVFICDLRGHGYSQRFVDEKYLVHIERFEDFVNDFDCFVENVVMPRNLKPFYLYAHSMGGAVALSYLEQHNDVFDKAVISTPMVKPNTICPNFFMSFIVGIMNLMGLGKKPIPFTYAAFPDRERFDLVSNGSPVRYSYYHNVCSKDENLQTFSGSARWMQQCIKGTSKLRKDSNIRKITTPVLMFEVHNDKKVISKETVKLCNKLQNGKLISVNDDKIRHELYTAYEEVLVDYFTNVLDYFN